MPVIFVTPHDKGLVLTCWPDSFTSYHGHTRGNTNEFVAQIAQIENVCKAKAYRMTLYVEIDDYINLTRKANILREMAPIIETHLKVGISGGTKVEYDLKAPVHPNPDVVIQDISNLRIDKKRRARRLHREKVLARKAARR